MDTLPFNDTPPDLPEPAKFCINCKHIATNSSRDWMLYQCFHPTNRLGLNLVTGDTNYRNDSTCMETRDDTYRCGSQGNWYEVKPSLPDLPVRGVPLTNVSTPSRRTPKTQLTENDF